MLSWITKIKFNVLLINVKLVVMIVRHLQNAIHVQKVISKILTYGLMKFKYAKKNLVH